MKKDIYKYTEKVFKKNRGSGIIVEKIKERSKVEKNYKFGVVQWRATF